MVCLSVIAGCATGARVQPGSGSRLTVEGRTYDQVWQAAVTVVGRSLTTSAGTDKGRGEIQAEGGGSRFSPDALVGIFITPASTASDRYVVEVVSRKRISVPLIGKNWEETIIESLKRELKL